MRFCSVTYFSFRFRISNAEIFPVYQERSYNSGALPTVRGACERICLGEVKTKFVPRKILFIKLLRKIGSVNEIKNLYTSA